MNGIQSSRFSDSSDEIEKSRLLKHHRGNGQHLDCLPWAPRELLHLLDDKLPEIVLISEADIQDFKNDAKSTQHMGLSVIEVSSNKTLIMCITTATKIYVLQSKKSSNITFLKKTLDNKRLKFYTIDGLWDSEALFRYTGITLSDNVVDLVTFDLQMSLRQMVTKNPAPLCQYSTTHIHDKVKPRLLNHKKLVLKWLEADIDMEISRDELNLFKIVPLNQNARNVIMKRSAVIHPLAKRMLQEHDHRLRLPSLDLYSFATRANDSLREEYDKRDRCSYMELCHFLENCPDTV